MPEIEVSATAENKLAVVERAADLPEGTDVVEFLVNYWTRNEFAATDEPDVMADSVTGRESYNFRQD